MADGHAKRRLLLALALVAAGALLAALTPIGLKLVVDSLSVGTAGNSILAAVGLEILYVSTRGQKKAPAPTFRAQRVARREP